MKKILLLIMIAAVSITTDAQTIKLTDFGAIPNDGVSDCQAVTDAFDFAYTNKGGTIEFPAGVTDLKCNEMFNFTRWGIDNRHNLTLKGQANSVVVIDNDPTRVVFFVGNMNIFRVESLHFVGADPNDNGTDETDPMFNCNYLFYSTSTRNVIFQNVQISGVGAKSDMIYVLHGSFIAENLYFGGSASGQTHIRTVFGNATIRNAMAIDWSDDDGKRYSKTPFIFTQYFYYHDAPEDTNEAISKGVITLDNITIDEGIRYGITVKNNYSAVLTNIKMNLSGTLSASVLEFDNVTDAYVNGVWASWKGGVVIRAKNGSSVEARGVVRNAAIPGIVESEVDQSSTVSCEKCAAR